MFESTLRTKEEMPEKWDLVCIDTDLCCYRASFAAQGNTYNVFDEDRQLLGEFPSARDAKSFLKEQEDFLGIDTSEWLTEAVPYVNPEEDALEAVDTILGGIKRHCPTDDLRLYIDGKGNYRDEISLTNVYKGERNAEKPVHFQAVRNYLIQHHGAKLVETREVDDMIGCAMAYGHRTGKKVLGVSTDKDSRGVPGYLFDYFGNQFYEIDELEADRFFFWQCLTGDKSVDNIEGLKGVSLEFCEKYGLRKSKLIGKKTAEQLLEGLTSKEEMFSIVKEAYQSYHGDAWRDMLNENGSLLWIQRKRHEIFDVSWYEES